MKEWWKRIPNGGDGSVSSENLFRFVLKGLASPLIITGIAVGNKKASRELGLDVSSIAGAIEVKDATLVALKHSGGNGESGCDYWRIFPRVGVVEPLDSPVEVIASLFREDKEPMLTMNRIDHPVLIKMVDVLGGEAVLYVGTHTCNNEGSSFVFDIVYDGLLRAQSLSSEKRMNKSLPVVEVASAKTRDRF